MRKTRWMAVLALLAAVGCNRKPPTSFETLLVEQMRLMDDMGTLLETVKDEATAKTAMTNLAALQKKGEELKKRMDAFGKPDEAKMGELKKKYESQLQAAVTKLMRESMRVAAIPGGPEVLKSMRPAGQ